MMDEQRFEPMCQNANQCTGILPDPTRLTQPDIYEYSYLFTFEYYDKRITACKNSDIKNHPKVHSKNAWTLINSELLNNEIKMNCDHYLKVRERGTDEKFFNHLTNWRSQVICITIIISNTRQSKVVSTKAASLISVETREGTWSFTKESDAVLPFSLPNFTVFTTSLLLRISSSSSGRFSSSCFVCEWGREKKKKKKIWCYKRQKRQK